MKKQKNSEVKQSYLPDKKKFVNPFNHEGWLTYFHQLLQRFRYIRFLGLPSPKDLPNVLLRSLYVPLYLGTSYSLDKDDRNDTFTIGDSLNRFRRLVLLGDPGAGKSTIVSHLVNLFAGRKNHEYTELLGNLIPIPLILRELKIGKEITFDDLLQQFMAQSCWPEELSREDLNQVMESGQALFLLDGLDEVGSKARREALRTAIIEGGMKTYPRCAWALTSRIIGYEEVAYNAHDNKLDKEELLKSIQLKAHNLTDKDFLHSMQEIIEEKKKSISQQSTIERLYILPFNDKQIETFIKKWYLLREDDEHLRQASINSLTKAIDETPNIKRLAQTPFLLTMMAIIHRNYATLPSGRVQIYDQIVEAYLDSIDKFRKLKSETGLQPNQHRMWLSQIAYEMQLERNDRGENQNLDQKRSEILVPKERVLSKIKAFSSAQIHPEQELKHISNRSGLFIPKGPDLYSFVHLSFQEYFASLFLYEKVMSFSERENTIDELKKLKGKTIWHETVILLFEKISNHHEASSYLFDRISEGPSQEHDGQDLLLYLELLGDIHSGLSDENRAFIVQRILKEDQYFLKLDLFKKCSLLPVEIRKQFLEPGIVDYLEELLKNNHLPSKEFLVFLQNISVMSFNEIEKILNDTHILENILPKDLYFIYPLATSIGPARDQLINRMPIKKWFTCSFFRYDRPLTMCIDFNFPKDISKRYDFIRWCSSIRILMNMLLYKTSIFSLEQVLSLIEKNRKASAQDLARDLTRDLTRDRAWDLHLEVDQILDIAQEWNWSPNWNRYLNLARSILLSFARKSELDQVINLVHNRNRELNLEIVLGKKRGLKLEVFMEITEALGLARERESDLEINLALALDRELDLHRNLTLSRVLDQNLELDRAKVLTKALNPKPEKDRNWMRFLVRAKSRELGLAKDLGLARDQVKAPFQTKDLTLDLNPLPGSPMEKIKFLFSGNDDLTTICIEEPETPLRFRPFYLIYKKIIRLLLGQGGQTDWMDIIEQTNKIQSSKWAKKHIPFLEGKEVQEAIKLLYLGMGKDAVFKTQWFKQDHPYSRALHAKPSEFRKMVDQFIEKYDKLED